MRKMLKDLPDLEIKNEWQELINSLRETSIRFLVSVQKTRKRSVILLDFIDTEKVLSYRLLISKTDYITQDLSEETITVKTGSLEYILGYSWNKYCIPVDQASLKILKSFFNNQESSLSSIDSLQDEIKAKRLKKRHKEEKEEIDAKMRQVKRLPNHFKKWLNDEVLISSRYIYYKYTAKKMVSCFCTHCKKDLNLSKENHIIKHNAKGVCPNCKSNIEFKAMGKTVRLSDTGKATLIQKVEDGIVARHFFVTKNYLNFREPVLKYTEFARYFYGNNGSFAPFEYRRFKQTNEVRWCKDILDSQLYYNNQYDFLKSNLYKNNLPEELSSTLWEYSAIKEYARNKSEVFIHDYLIRYIKFPGLEYLVKLKLFNLVNNILENWHLTYRAKYSSMKDVINFNAHSIFEILNINREQLKLLIEIDGGLQAVKIIQDVNKSGLKISEKELRLLITANVSISKLVAVAKYTKANKAIKYVMEQSNYNENHFSLILNDWIDFINDCKLLGHDLTKSFILMPKDLQKTHLEIGKLVENNKNELLDKGIRNISKKLAKALSWQYEDYIFVVPRSYDDLVKEGNVLEHCVARGDYAENIVLGKTFIVFLRKKENIKKPFYTIEINAESMEIAQCRGKCNKIAKGNIEEVVKRFKNNKLLSMTA